MTAERRFDWRREAAPEIVDDAMLSRTPWLGAFAMTLTCVALALPQPTRASEPGVASVYYGVVPEAQGDRVSLELDHMSLGDALDLLLHDSGLSLSTGDSLTMRVSGALDSVTVGEAVDQLLTREGLSYHVNADLLSVDRSETRLFSVNQIAPADHPFWPELQKNLPEMLGPEGRFILNTRAGLLTVVGSPDALARVSTFLRQVEDDLSRQIHVEAQIFETALKDEESAGVDWRVNAFGWDNVTGGTDNHALAEQNTIGDAGAFQLGLIRTGRLSFLIDLLSSRGKLRVLSRPSVTTMGNTPAVFRATEQVPYYVIETFASTGSSPYVQYRIDFRDAGVELSVLGRSGPDGIITLQVHPRVSTVTGYTPSLPNLPPQPVVDLREMETTVRMREGETLVIGGLIQEREQHTIRGVPVVSKIPWLGGLFRHTSVVKQNQELTLVLTPKLLMDAERGRFRASGASFGLQPSWPGGTRHALAAYEHDRAVAAYIAGEPEEAVERSRRALAIAPDLELEKLNLGLFLAESGRIGEARTTWQALSNQSEFTAAANANLAALDLLQGLEGDSSVLRDHAPADPALAAVWAANAATRLSRNNDEAAARELLRTTAARLPGGPAKRLIEDRLQRLEPLATP